MVKYPVVFDVVLPDFRRSSSPTIASFGRWAFAELTDVDQMEEDFEGALEAEFRALVERAAP